MELFLTFFLANLEKRLHPWSPITQKKKNHGFIDTFIPIIQMFVIAQSTALLIYNNATKEEGDYVCKLTKL